ncbi:DUF2799 domain-containing protein [Photobacterium sp. ZSDE20]|uniref:DUF2799 domain-containing protein n=1 Tax=Photobacterium pectinilyticum TaxID=2906793 RepID=A0ABT1N8K9_9GAMM|nr:DUF2799 domain-containing protein [Photobacterium sp. ZSDE20]MCQ1061100.1 DUF2799 domain-containing protein [Photobacterium sp. ZSDE20]MDD1829218.1 DUF2799 domain-containing protein [Photobacterium sp. ZSDE20]
MKHLVLLVAVLGLAACTGQSYDTELAQENQWKMIGVKDGKNGRLVRTEAELNRLSEMPEGAINDYRLGYQQGIEDYCLPYKTYKHGKQGEHYTGQCLNTKHENLATQRWKAGYREYVSELDLLLLNNE